MQGHSSPTVRRRRLGMDLRQLREAQGLTAADAAQKLGWYPAKVSRIETARITVHWGDVAELLDLYNVEAGETRNALIRLAKEARKQDWWQPYNDLLNKNLATFISLESAADTLRVYQPVVVPGLLQTEEYAGAVVQDGSILELREQELERRVALRMERQATIKERTDLRLWIVLHEAVLHSVIGSHAIMAEQLRRLTGEARSPRTTMQVIPFNAGAHPGSAGAFGVFRFAADDDRDIAYTDTVAGVLYLDRQADVRATNLAFDHLCAVALPPADSVELLAAIAQRHEQREDDHDARLQPRDLEEELPQQ